MLFRWATTLVAPFMIVFGFIDKDFMDIIIGACLGLMSLVFWVMYFEEMKEARKAVTKNKNHPI